MTPNFIVLGIDRPRGRLSGRAGAGVRQPTLQDLAVALALTAYGGTLVFARFLERWL